MQSILLLLTLLFFGPSICLAKKYGKWSYYRNADHGPNNWGRIKGGSSCLGSNQSPIDINTAETIEQKFKPFKLRNYNSNGRSGNARPVEMSNNGKTVKIKLEGDYLVTGGGLPSTYRAAQLHFHWGADWTKGSEHTLDGQAFPAELHIVHFDTVRYPSIGDALRQPDGLAVLGFFIKLGRHNSAWDVITNQLSSVRYVSNRFDYTQNPFRLSSLIPMRHLDKYYRYRGSLTTPGCYESVVWTVFHHPIELSELQIANFRTLTRLFQTPSKVRERFGGGAERDADLILDNFRPVQRLNFRNVYQSFEHDYELESEYEAHEHESESSDVEGYYPGMGTGQGYPGTGTGQGNGGTDVASYPHYGGTGGWSDQYQSLNGRTGGGGGSNGPGVQLPGGTGGTGTGQTNTGGWTDYFGFYGDPPSTPQDPAYGGTGGNSVGGAGTDPYGGAGAADPYGGAGAADPYGGAGAADPYGGAGAAAVQNDPYGMYGGYTYGDVGGGGFGGGAYGDALGGAYAGGAYGGADGGQNYDGNEAEFDDTDFYADVAPPPQQEPEEPQTNGNDVDVAPKTPKEPYSPYDGYGNDDDVGYPGYGNGYGANVGFGDGTGYVGDVGYGGGTGAGINPFDDNAGVNPFDDAAGVNPFDDAAGVVDPYHADNEHLAGLAKMWQQLLNGKDSNLDEATYYDGDFDDNALIGANGEVDYDHDDENAMYGNYNGFTDLYR